MSDKLNRLIQAARQHPEKLSSATIQRLNQHLQRTGQQPIQLPAARMPWGRRATLGEIAAVRDQQPLPPAAVSRVDVSAIQQQQLEQAREIEKRRTAEQKKKPGIVGTFYDF